MGAVCFRRELVVLIGGGRMRWEGWVAEEYMTVEELAALLRKPVGTLRNWRARKPPYGPPSFRAGGTVLYDRAEVEAWIEAQKEAGRARVTTRASTPPTRAYPAAVSISTPPA